MASIGLSKKQRILSLEESISKLEEKLNTLKQEIKDIEETKNLNLKEKLEIEDTLRKMEDETNILSLEIKEFAEKNKNFALNTKGMSWEEKRDFLLKNNDSMLVR